MSLQKITVHGPYKVWMPLNIVIATAVSIVLETKTKTYQLLSKSIDVKTVEL